ncbi:MAG: hypothetical protein R3350_10515, partial [Saprospiraceae bacterium]|nr:hypothetical protein [Saprospiraceae bacterium]
MKLITKLRIWPLMVLALPILLSSCLKDACEATQTYLAFNPVYVQPEDFRHPLEMTGARALEQTGKIYYYRDHIFVGEVGEGIHIIDNREPESPLPVGFIEISGNRDIAVRGGLLYADNYTDLVVIDISNPSDPEFLNRTEDVFPVFHNDPHRGMLVDYVGIEQTVEVPCEDATGDVIFLDGLWLARPEANVLQA